MSREAESRFTLAPSVNHPRSTFNLPFEVSTTGNVGDLIPFYVEEVLPGDTFQVDTSSVIRMTPMVSCPYDDIVQDTYFFYCPNRIVMDDWIRFFGESDTNAWTTPPTYKVPFINAPANGWTAGTIADYMGIPTNVSGFKVNALPFRMYAKIYEEFFRDENVQDHLYIPTDSVTRTGVNTGNYITDTHLGGKVLKANKLHDYFTSCLPNVSKGSIAEVGMPVLTGSPIDKSLLNDARLTFRGYNDMNTAQSIGSDYYMGIYGSTGTESVPSHEFGNFSKLSAVWGSNQSIQPVNSQAHFVPDNLYASVSVPALRTAFQIQRFLELQARVGSRYTESLHAIYSVNVPDYRINRPEYLGGSRIDIDVNQVVNMTSPQTASDDPLGTIGAYSLTNATGAGFTHSFTEAGFVIGLMVLRYKHTYQQGLARMWTRGEDRTDYYMPVFANISEQPVYKREIMLTGTNTDMDVFGYQEAFADYRQKFDLVTGLMKSNTNSGLDSYHFADNYNTVPTLSEGWMKEDHTNIDRALAVSSATAGFQFYANILVNNKATRLMPLYSVPGLIDHN